MHFYSLNNHSPAVNFKHATIQGQAPDGGLYYPSHIPQQPISYINNLVNISNTQIAYDVLLPYVGDAIPPEKLYNIVEEAFDFAIPLVPITENVSSLELFHGPTLAFKDVGARFMSRCLSYFVKDAKQKVTVLVATSGDTGGAVASGFYNIPGINVVILYPSGKVSKVQEKQLTTYGNNITALEVAGNFDDCQAMVKAAFSDTKLNGKLFLTSANSINVARWLPQQVYYYFAYKQLVNKEIPTVLSVPTGNLGNAAAGLLAMASGLPFHHLIAACNSNATVANYFTTKQYSPQPTIATISNAMDVSNPSNFVRMLRLYANNLPQLYTQVSSISVTEAQTAEALLQLHTQHNYLPDTHGAVGYYALQQYLQQHPTHQGILLETAHPIKFYDVVEPIINAKVPMPTSIQKIMELPSKSIKIKATSDALMDYLHNL